ncbi:glycerol kinase GlpK [Hoyosella altamirensis]|uniref:glycerol kinase n=1 Tax=Hoyosella altamirensis TaxID=616997 RepID=A0A839RPV5_9ACTN|nr:glycerol kinase GlpK [Hoyosella altamirensis]MBB3038349.1 glycerol kinase [Hoyosella altamirensis]
MTEHYIAALDQGTTSTRCIVFDRHGRMVSVAQHEHHQHFPQPGWVEHDAAEIWAVTRRIIPEALRKAKISARQIAALGIANQRETTVLWDRTTGTPLHRAIVWQDTRTSGMISNLSSHVDLQDITHRAGAPLSNYFSGPRLKWLLESDPRLHERVLAGDVLFGTMDSWLVWNLTGGPNGGIHMTDATNASRTMLMNLETLEWDPVLLGVFGIPQSVLPEIRPSLGAVGITVDPVPGIRICSVIGDQQAALIGQTALRAGEAKCTFGTGSFLLLNTGADLVRSRRGLISTVAYTAEGEPPVYALEGANPAAGTLVDWFRDHIGAIRSSAEIETLASQVDDCGGCYVVPSFSGLLAPHWVTTAQGIVVGLTSYVTRAHLARAVLQATAFQTRDLVEAMNSDARDAGTLAQARYLAVDGGMTANNLLMQMVADLTNVPVVRPMMAETVALGAAYSAGLAAGYWADKAVLRRNWKKAAEWQPHMKPDTRDGEVIRWTHAVRLAAEWGRLTAT